MIMMRTRMKRKRMMVNAPSPPILMYSWMKMTGSKLRSVMIVVHNVMHVMSKFVLVVQNVRL